MPSHDVSTLAFTTATLALTTALALATALAFLLAPRPVLSLLQELV